MYIIVFLIDCRFVFLPGPWMSAWMSEMSSDKSNFMSSGGSLVNSEISFMILRKTGGEIFSNYFK